MQKKLQFRTEQKRVVLSAVEEVYRRRCIADDRDLPVTMLHDTRCQRRGFSRGFFDGMPAFERARELADEECIMRMDSWEYEPCTYIDWSACNAVGKAAADAFQRAYVELANRKMAEAR